MKINKYYILFVPILFFSFLLTVSSGQAAESLSIEAEAAILIDANSGKILYEKDADKALPPASMTKMMTEYLVHDALENGEISWDQEVSISDYAYQVSQNYQLSNVPLLTEVKYTVAELYEAMAIYSANGATIALAELVAGSEGKFVEMMNEKATELGLKEVKFVNTTGLNNKDLYGQHPAGSATDENILSARSTALLAYHLLNDHPSVLQIASIPTKDFTKGLTDPVKMLNWNWMLDGLDLAYPGVDGLKTGSTDLAGFSFTGTAERDGVRLISVVMKTNSAIARFRETAKLFDWGFSQFTKETIVTKGEQVEGKETVPVVNGKEKTVAIEAADSLEFIVQHGDSDKYERVVQLDENKVKDGKLSAPLEKGEQVGTLLIQPIDSESDYGYITGEKVMSVPLITQEEVKKANWLTLGIRNTGSFISDLWGKMTTKIKNIF